MGVSTDAILFYGYCWSEEMSLIPEGEIWQELLLGRRGVPNPFGGFPAPETIPYAKRRKLVDDWCVEHRAELDAWRAAKQGISQEFGVEIGTHCSDQCAMPYVFAVGSQIVAARGHPEQITTLAVGVDWPSRLNHFLETLKIARPQPTPGWWLVSDWG